MLLNLDEMARHATTLRLQQAHGTNDILAAIDVEILRIVYR
jgi:hypothetical protein